MNAWHPHLADPSKLKIVIFSGPGDDNGAKIVESCLDGSTKQAAVPLVIFSGTRSSSWKKVEASVSFSDYDLLRERLKCSADDDVLQSLIAEKLASARPDLVLMLRWPYYSQLGSNFWALVDLPRDLSIPNSIGAKVFYLTDTAADAFPDSHDPVKHFYNRTRDEGESGEFIENTLWLMDEHDSPKLLSRSTFAFHMLHTVKQVRREVQRGYLDVLEMGTEVIRDPLDPFWYTETGERRDNSSICCSKRALDNIQLEQISLDPPDQKPLNGYID